MQLNCLKRFVGSRDCILRCTRLYNTMAGDLNKTALHDYHVSQGARMVEFAGWSMPVQYSNLSIIQSTLHTRQHASLFDVSHMLQLEVSGEDAESFLESQIVADLRSLSINTGMLSVLTTESGGIIDDLITSLKHYDNRKSSVSLTPMDDRSLIAFQGPKVASLLETLGLSSLKFMSSAVGEVCGVSQCRVTRCGYTGEDGVEKLAVSDSVEWAGLGARDILRLEAGLCLYGNDISEQTTPVEAGLAWCISGRRRKEGGFLGSDVIRSQLKNKPPRRRVGLISHSGPPARGGAIIMDQEGEEVGKKNDDWKNDVEGKPESKASKAIRSAVQFVTKIAKKAASESGVLSEDQLAAVEAGADAVNNQAQADPNTSLKDRLKMGGKNRLLMHNYQQTY
ncbi:Aminomethyltransferase, mitochondrial [Geodia barretti]|uniref:Aminomethyltransferase, mitochondrial n=1 Tax=Geodia barretti TaxID=519541 RepID=A0AA35RHN1_GEOBA|nr:Aminomethyltransferase, mitochondrial [Geodia barretti]